MKNLVFPRIFLHCVALGFIVSGLLLSVGSEVQIFSGTLKCRSHKGLRHFLCPFSSGELECVLFFQLILWIFLFGLKSNFPCGTRTVFLKNVLKSIILLICAAIAFRVILCFPVLFYASVIFLASWARICSPYCSTNFWVKASIS